MPSLSQLEGKEGAATFDREEPKVIEHRPIENAGLRPALAEKVSELPNGDEFTSLSGDLDCSPGNIASTSANVSITTTNNIATTTACARAFSTQDIVNATHTTAIDTLNLITATTTNSTTSKITANTSNDSVSYSAPIAAVIPQITRASDFNKSVHSASINLALTKSCLPAPDKGLCDPKLGSTSSSAPSKETQHPPEVAIVIKRAEGDERTLYQLNAIDRCEGKREMEEAGKVLEKVEEEKEERGKLRKMKSGIMNFSARKREQNGGVKYQVSRNSEDYCRVGFCRFF